MKNVLVAPHTVPHIHAHLVSAFGDAAFAAESHGAHVRNPIQHELYTGGTEMRDGYVHIPDAPGFGVEVNWDCVEKYRV